jgi:transposase
MISLAPGTKVFLACSPIDLGAGFNGLAAKVQQMIGQDPFGGSLYIFRGKRGDYFKALYWDGSGLWLLAKRLEKGRFVWPPVVDGAMMLTAAQMAVLVEAMDWRRTERVTRQIEQLELRLEELETGEAEAVAKAGAADPVIPIRERAKPKRKPLPDHLPRQEVVHQPADDGACTCPDCGKGMARLGEDISEVLDYVPGHFQVIRHVRPKYACTACDAITQAPAPPMPTPARSCDPRHPGTSAGVEVLRPPSAVSPERDLCARGARARPLNAGRLGFEPVPQAADAKRRQVRREGETCEPPWPSGLAARSGGGGDPAACLRGGENPWRRHHGAGVGARARAHRNRAVVGLCA